MLRSSHSDEPGLNLEVICLCGHGGSPWKKSRNIPGLKLPRPRRDNARHPGVRNELAHVLVVMNDDSQKDVVHGGVGIEEFRFPLEIRRCFGGARVRKPGSLGRDPQLHQAIQVARICPSRRRSFAERFYSLPDRPSAPLDVLAAE